MSQCVWNAMLDDKYDCTVMRTVMRTGDYTGVLTIKENDETLFTKDVELSYNAQFGPDALDVMDWQNMIVEFIDSQ